MDKLNKLESRAKRLLAPTTGEASETMLVEVESVLAAVEAFREMHQRAEAAEAQRAGLAKQEPVKEDEDGNPVGFIDWYERKFAGMAFKGTGHVADCDDAWRAAIDYRPAPAAVPVDLLPCKGFLEDTSDESVLIWQRGWNACRDEMLRRIEGLK